MQLKLILPREVLVLFDKNGESVALVTPEQLQDLIKQAQVLLRESEKVNA